MIEKRTDLAIEARELVSKEYPKEIPGVEVDVDKSDNITITRVKIKTEEAEKIMGKPLGDYITLEVPKLREKDVLLQEEVSKNFADEIKNLSRLPIDATVMVVGLGNWNVTPDALGPKVIQQLLITRHIMETPTGEMGKGVRSLCAIAPGVLGITGIETGEIIQGVIEKVKPDLIIAIDALASRNMARVSTTIQISNTGIHPGSGVGNKRMGITRETLGVPVIAVGIPTVVDAATMANDTLDMLIDSLMEQTEKGSSFYKLLKDMDKNEKYRLIYEVISPFVGNLMVTPKEIDTIVDDLARVLAGGLNIALHPGITFDEVTRYLH